jgi:hypothetical protein
VCNEDPRVGWILGFVFHLIHQKEDVDDAEQKASRIHGNVFSSYDCVKGLGRLLV